MIDDSTYLINCNGQYWEGKNGVKGQFGGYTNHVRDDNNKKGNSVGTVHKCGAYIHSYFTHILADTVH